MYVCIEQIFVNPYVSATPTWSNPKLRPKPFGFVGSETGSTHMNSAAERFVFRIPVGFFTGQGSNAIYAMWSHAFIG